MTNSRDNPDFALTQDQALQQAVIHHKAGRLQDAERLYRAILQAQPQHPEANHNLGVLAVQVKQPAAGLPYFKTALEANPNQGAILAQLHRRSDSDRPDWTLRGRCWRKVGSEGCRERRWMRW